MAGDDDDTWLIELESALLDGCTAQEINALTKGKKIPVSLRPDVWLLCLNCQDAGNQLLLFDEIFDLPNQNELRDDVKKFVEKLGNEEDDKLAVISDVESIITFYCKSKNTTYTSNNGWIDILLPLLSLKLPRSDTYNLFERILKLYTPKGCSKNGVPCHILRLILQYHDPELCSFLDTKRITPEQYCSPWLKSLFAGTCSLDVALYMWDLYFQRSDPFFIFFLCLIMIINAREQLLQMKNDDKTAIIQILTNMPADLEANDVSDFCSLAHYYSLKTPQSFRDDVLEVLFSESELEINSRLYSQALCLPVAVHELIESATLELANSDSVKFFLVDCRPTDQYNAGHLSTAFHLDCNLMLQEPAAFNTAVQGLLNAQRQALAAGSLAAGEHLCFVGSGRTEEDSYAHMVVASFLKRNTKHVSMLDGGFVAIHDYFGPHMTDCLEEHNASACLVCVPNNTSVGMSKNVASATKTSENMITKQLFSKLSSAMKAKSQEVKGKLIEYIVNPNSTYNNSEWHVSANDRKEQRYRNVPPVFSINDEDEDSRSDSLRHDLTLSDSIEEIVNVQSFLKEPNTIDNFQCQEVLLNGYMHDSYIVVTETHLIVLRDIPNKRGLAKIMSRRPLSTIVKITAKKRHPELITFKYGIPDGDNLLIKDMDRFLIPNASVATKVVSNQIVQQLDNKLQ
ncbi:TBC1 domain family member 23 [Bombyx mandarina]|uniref:TBC1 domain family member 23 n=2 Tax=Bombyx TaxID=7090 RepID=A0A8R2LZN6_BOMMO|nr:TBC1 domain family member 23 [Bombyx mandarina]XP_037870506.1 TBC1 domain family member 23 [Bombyx mori]